MLIADGAQLLARGLERAFGLVLCSALLEITHEAGQAFLLLRDVEPVHRLCKPQIGVDARHHDPGVDRQQLDADERHAHIGVDDKALVQNRVDDVCQACR